MNSVINDAVANKVFPMVGGVTGAVTQVNGLVLGIPSLGECIYIAFAAALGAIVGYIVKLLLDIILKRQIRK